MKFDDINFTLLNKHLNPLESRKGIVHLHICFYDLVKYLRHLD